MEREIKHLHYPKSGLVHISHDFTQMYKCNWSGDIALEFARNFNDLPIKTGAKFESQSHKIMNKKILLIGRSHPPSERTKKGSMEKLRPPP